MATSCQSPHDEAELFVLNDTDDDQPQTMANSRNCLLSSDDEVDGATESHLNGHTREKRRRFAVGLVTVVTFLACVAAVANGKEIRFWDGKGDTVASKYSTLGNAQPAWQIVTKERDLCSKVTDNCFSTKCCTVAGYRCFAKSDTVAKCMKHCTVGTDSPTCALAEVSIGFEEGPAETMFCFSVYTHETGSTKHSYEKQLITKQHSQKASIFACDASAVYSDVVVSLGGGLSTIQVHDVEGDWHFAKRKTSGAWVNTGMFKQVWKAMGRAGTYKNYAWTVKVDPDAVFLSHRLAQRIRMIPRPKTGIFLVNCKHVDYGFFGNLEVFSSMAFSILVANIDTCNTQLPWKIGLKGGKYGPMGEDLFAEKCMEKHGVAKGEAFDITIDGMCPSDRPMNFLHSKKWKANCKDVSSAAAMHPFKKPDEYFQCLEQTVAFEALSMAKAISN